jgi:hypothetical protein
MYLYYITGGARSAVMFGRGQFKHWIAGLSPVCGMVICLQFSVMCVPV